MDFTSAFGDKDGMRNEASSSKEVAAIVVAAGAGTRMAMATPKQFLPLCGKPVLCHSVDAFLSHPAVCQIVVVAAATQMDLVREALEDSRYNAANIQIVTGGALRQESVRNGLAAIARGSADLVAIHDAARPLLSHAVIDRLIAALSGNTPTGNTLGALPVMPIADTVKTITEAGITGGTTGGTTGTITGTITGTLNRDSLRAAQTPQLFDLTTIIELHEKNHGKAFTDDVSMAEDAGLKITAVAGEQRLMKLTQNSDLALLTALALSTREKTEDHQSMTDTDFRVGNGFDVHKFAETPGPIMLAGISVPSARGMLAHSDGDVGLHALCDAIFGALGDGDIGYHFPPSEARWKDADSAAFLKFAVDRCTQHNAEVRNLDLTIICETPKITPHRDAMRARIAEIAGLSVDRIGVKATTSEGLGFTGRGEGIAAQATATLIFRRVL